MSDPEYHEIETEEDQCYICLENCTERSKCTCGAKSHFICGYKYCMTNKTTQCSICKTKDMRFEDLDFFFDYNSDDEDDIERVNFVTTQTSSMKRFLYCFFTLSVFFFLFTSFDEYGHFRFLPPVAYIFMLVMTIPISLTCSTKQSVGIRRTTDFTDEDGGDDII